VSSERESPDAVGCGSDVETGTGDNGIFFLTRDDVRFLYEKTSYRQVFYVPDYHFDDIRKDDVVVDIGANAGAFCIRASRFSDHVIAVEPLTTGLLARNIALNRSPVRVLDLALGDGSRQEITWDGLRKTLNTVNLRTIIDRAGGCDFLKCDCEGAEWVIRPQDLNGIRRIEMELHLPPICAPPDPSLLDYISRNYEFELQHIPGHGPMGLMGFLHAKRAGY
jgi:FkbM family methyltransferase